LDDLAYQRLLNTIDSLPKRLVTILESEDNHLPASGSPAAKEDAELAVNEAIEVVNNQAWMFTEAAGDYIFGIARLLRSPVMTMAPAACARSVLDASARGLWLLEPAIASRLRLARSMALRFDGLVEQRRLLQEHPDSARVQARLSQVEEQARTRGIGLRFDRSGTLIGVEPKIPSATDLARRYLRADFDFRLLSAVTHSQNIALIATTYRQTPGHPQRMVKYGDPRWVQYLLTRPVHWYLRLLWAHVAYCGWESTELIKAMDAAADEVGVRGDLRPW